LGKQRALGLQGFADLATAVGQDFFHDLREMLGQMEPIGTLGGLRSPESGCGSIIFSPVPAHHFNFRVLSHPGGSRLSVPIRE
jgi:hypothetical protein